MTTKARGEPPPRPEVVARHRGLVGRTVLVSVLTLLSRVLGFVREVVMAFLFGDGSAVSDAFFTAWRVPNLFRRLFGEGALSTSLQAAVTEADADRGNEAGRRLFLRTLSLTAAILVVVSAVSMVLIAFMPDWMPVTGWAWLGVDPGPVRDLTVRLAPYIVLVCLAALCGGALHVRGHYAIPNLAPTVMNVTWIVTLVAIGIAFGWAESASGGRETVLGTQWDMARWLAWGVLLGGVVQLVIHVPPLRRFGFLGGQRESPGTPTEGPGAWTVLRTAAPLALGAAVYQVNVMIDGLMAEGLLADGGPSALYYANRIQQFPLALVAVAAINAVFPALKARAHTGDRGEVRRLHDRAQYGILFLALPAAVGLFLLARPIASALFEHGNYGPAGTARIAAALRMLAIALVPAGAAGLLGRTYIAMGDLKTPVRISIVMLLLNVGLNGLFVGGLGMDADGLALATAVSSWGNLLWLFLAMRAKLGLPGGEGGSSARFRSIAGAAAASGLAAWAVQRFVGSAVGTELALVVAIGAGIAAYLWLAKLLAIPEWDDFRSRLRRRWNR